MTRDIGLKPLPKRITVAPRDANLAGLQQNQDARLTTGLLCADGDRPVMRFYQLVADVLSSIAETERLARAA